MEGISVVSVPVSWVFANCGYHNSQCAADSLVEETKRISKNCEATHLKRAVVPQKDELSVQHSVVGFKDGPTSETRPPITRGLIRLVNEYLSEIEHNRD